MDRKSYPSFEGEPASAAQISSDLLRSPRCRYSSCCSGTGHRVNVVGLNSPCPSIVANPGIRRSWFTVHQKDDLLATIRVGVSALQRSTAVMGGVSPFDRGHCGCRSEPSRRFGEKVRILSAAANGSCEADLCREHPNLVVTHAASNCCRRADPVRAHHRQWCRHAGLPADGLRCAWPSRAAQRYRCARRTCHNRWMLIG
jgi:hypothetical protein